MIYDETFWKNELEAPLLRRNAGYLQRDSIDYVKRRAEHWLDLCRAYFTNLDSLTPKTKCYDLEFQRIFEIDAERTFKTLKYRQNHTETLSMLYELIHDYHQGLGFIVAFFLLFFEKKDVIQLVVALNRHYVPGYFKAAPVAYVRDARTFEKVLMKVNPKVCKHIKYLITPEAYCSKWFVGFNIHVLPFPALADFFDAFFSKKGGLFHFQYSVSLINHLEKNILKTTDVSKILQYLRLDPSGYPDDMRDSTVKDSQPGSFFTKIVQDALNVELDSMDIDSFRDEAMAELQRSMEKKNMSDYDDEEIVFTDEESDASQQIQKK